MPPGTTPSTRVATAQTAMNNYLADEIKRFLDRPAEPVPRPSLPEAPPGAPIGEDRRF